MKKIFYKIALAIFLISVFVKPVSAALIIDPTQISGVLTRYVKKIQETAEKVVQLTNQVNLMATQGYNLKSLRDIAKKQAEKYYKKNKGKLKQLVKGTKDKKKKEKEALAENYKKGSIDLYQTKIKIATENLNEIMNMKDAAEKNKVSKEKECQQLQAQYEQAEEINPGSGDIISTFTCWSELETLTHEIEDFKNQYEKTEEAIKSADKELKKFQNGEDEVEKINEEKIEKLKESQDEEESMISEGETKEKEWDSENALQSYELSNEEYETFMENYFYNPNSLGAAKNEKGKAQIAYDSKISQINRNRKYLFVNTAIHLLQVTATTRRELPEGIKRTDDMFEQTIKSEGGELGNIAAYSNVRVENVKALFLYAKLLSAKIQYLAARDLMAAETTKEFVDEEGKKKEYSGFNLEKYILTKEYIEKMLKDAKKNKKDITNEEIENSSKWVNQDNGTD